MGLFNIFKKKGSKTNKKDTNINNKIIPVFSNMQCEKSVIDNTITLTIRQKQDIYNYTELEKSEGIQGYDYMVKASINNEVFNLYFAAIPSRDIIGGWTVMTIDNSVYEGIKSKTILGPFKVVRYLGQIPCFANDGHIPHIIVELMNIIELEIITKEINEVVNKYNDNAQSKKVDMNNIFIGKCVNKPGCIGCFSGENGWYLYRVDDRFNLLKNGPFSINGIIVALLHALYIPSELQNRTFSDEEYRLYLNGEKSV